ncbi:MAG: LTA synthase family protein [Proteobacteria bacterium]|nr:LTA synthase family protein [Desulfobulbaceae bacterium]MBU4151256.1 LTA synthase family protein [Pseudomonadota bacterium]
MNDFSTTIALNARLIQGKAAYLFINRYTAFLLGVFIYSLLAKSLGSLRGLVFINREGDLALSKQYLELACLVYLYCYCNMILRPSRWQPLLAAIPILLAYVGQDLYYLMYSNVLRLSEQAELPELLKVLTLKHIALLITTVAAPLSFFLWFINYRRFWPIMVGALPITLLIGVAEFYPEHYTTTYRKIGREIVFWSDAVSAENNGRFMMLLYREAERKIAQAKTKAFRDRPQYDRQAQQLATWIHTNSNNRNVHLVVLEGFIDPTLFKNAKYTKDPFHPSFKKLAGNKMGFSISPVVGGKTSQAEFEVLCGVPAFEELTGVEFNGFTGAQAYCLPGQLRLAGYQTIASNAYNPSFFNTPNAYQGIGFDEIYFPREYVNGSDTYLSRGDTKDEMEYMFDSELFSQNLEFITPLLLDKDRPPLFNYVLTVYGHFPHLLNEQKRPPVLKMLSPFKDPQLERAANQIFYRSKAVADYVSQLIELDEQSLIILISDHIPPGQFGRKSYKKLHYLDNTDESLQMNRILIIEDGKAKKHATIHHYDVPAMVMNYVTNGAYCQEHTCGFVENKLLDDRMARHDDYLRLMAHASE